MTARATHLRTDVPADSSNPDEIQPSDWLADHVLVDVASLSRSIQPATVTLSSADILDLHNTPVTLVAAPGAGKWVNVHNVTKYYTFGTVEYTASIDGTVYIAWGTTADETDWNVNVAGGIDIIGATRVGGTHGASSLVNQPLSACLVGGDDLTLGDGSLTITTWYSIEDVPA